MPDREKVIKGLEAIKETLADMRDWQGVTWVDDALALLKAQEPRVLTWEELVERKPFVLWVEDHATGARLFRLVYIDGIYRDIAYDYILDFCDMNRIEYGKTYRLWTEKPTEAQMEAVAWDD